LCPINFIELVQNSSKEESFSLVYSKTANQRPLTEFRLSYEACPLPSDIGTPSWSQNPTNIRQQLSIEANTLCQVVNGFGRDQRWQLKSTDQGVTSEYTIIMQLGVLHQLHKVALEDAFYSLLEIKK
jgi:hypothetical protein